MANGFVNLVKKGAQIVGAGAAGLIVGELGSLGGRMMISDFEYAVDAVNSKINPIEDRKRHWWSKPEPYNVRKQMFVSDIKAKKADKKNTKKSK